MLGMNQATDGRSPEAFRQSGSDLRRSVVGVYHVGPDTAEPVRQAATGSNRTWSIGPGEQLDRDPGVGEMCSQVAQLVQAEHNWCGTHAPLLRGEVEHHPFGAPVANRCEHVYDALATRSWHQKGTHPAGGSCTSATPVIARGGAEPYHCGGT